MKQLTGAYKQLAKTWTWV